MKPDLLAEALFRYGMQGAKTNLIRHNENMTYCVDNRYLLRIHKHAEGFQTGAVYDGMNRGEIYREELRFLDFLSSRGMEVQKPCPDGEGKLVTTLSDGTFATMLTWLPGRNPEKDEVDYDLCFRIGEMVGKLHKHARMCQKIPVLCYDAALCRRLKQKLYDDLGSGAFDAKWVQCMADAFDFIAKQMDAFGQDVIITHADLSLSNILITENGLVPIDFSLFGYCHPMMDLAMLYCSINGLENRRAIAAGYKKAGGAVCLKMLDACFALNILLAILLHSACWPGQEWFAARFKRWCEEVFLPLTRGEALFSDDFYLIHAN